MAKYGTAEYSKQNNEFIEHQRAQARAILRQGGAVNVYKGKGAQLVSISSLEEYNQHCLTVDKSWERHRQEISQRIADWAPVALTG